MQGRGKAFLLPNLDVCVYYCRTYYKAVRGGGRRRVDDMCYDRRRAEACVDESARHALANAGGREIVGKKEGEQKGSARGGTREEPGT